jgi:hypothetical protein
MWDTNKSDPYDAELEKAALNVQRVFRGMKVRKEAPLPSPTRSSVKSNGSVHDQVMQSILESTGADLNENHETTKCDLLGFVDSCSGVAILLNALHIGGQANCAMTSNPCYMSVEMMNTIDLVFALGFTFELIIRRGFAGSWSTFFWTHEDASWHIFDSVVVGLSLVSFVIAAIGADDGGSGLFSLFRLLRVLRLARVARFFRIFKQLTVMLMSLFDGMKTLVWAAMLLSLILYMIAILVVFTNEELIYSLRDTSFAGLVESLPMVMYVLFECMSEGCGNNIVRPLVDETGYRSLVLVFYPLFTVFTVFGVLNLFTAMFVDNTMEAARVNEDRLRQSRDNQSKLLASKIQKLVEVMIAEEKAAATEKGLPEEPVDGAAEGEGEILTKQTFQRALQNPDVRKLLSGMDISDTDHVLLFDVLDADGSGNLSVSEIVQGLVQVQAPARALDIVAVRLGMRAMQRQLKEQLAEQKESFDRLTAELSSLRKDQKQQGSALKRLTTNHPQGGITGVLQRLKTQTDSGPPATDSESSADRHLKF